MDPDVAESTEASSPQPRWQALSATQRRIAGVLVEKAKTTPDAYPLSLNAVITACNQKSNRSPLMNVSTEQADEGLEQLRLLGAVSEVQGEGRVPKYRHYMKDWLGVDGTELAVMAELLLRGEQTLGELRGRAARMAGIADVEALKPIVQSLMDKHLVVALTPEGRGQVVTHALYKEREMIQLRDRYQAAARQPDAEASDRPVTRPAASGAGPGPVSETPGSASTDTVAEVAALRGELSQLKDEVAGLRREIEDLWSNLR